VTGEEEGHTFVAQLAIAHPLAVFVAGVFQHRQQIFGLGIRALAPLFDDAVNDLVQIGDALVEATAVRGLHFAELRQEEFQRARHVRERALERVPDGLGLALDGRPEQRLGDDFERETHHVGVDIADFTTARAPLLRQSLRPLRHHLGVPGEAFPMKRGLREAPLTSPEIALARQQAVAQNRVQELQVFVFQPPLVLRDEDLFDQLRVTHQDDRHRPQRDVHDVAVPTGHLAQERERIAEIPQSIAEEGNATFALDEGTHAERLLLRAGSWAFSFDDPLGDTGDISNGETDKLRGRSRPITTSGHRRLWGGTRQVRARHRSMDPSARTDERISNLGGLPNGASKHDEEGGFFGVLGRLGRPRRGRLWWRRRRRERPGPLGRQRSGARDVAEPPREDRV
jgi:hypothetical protein